MKTILTVTLLMLSTMFIYSCGSYDQDEAGEELVKVICEKTFTCDEAKAARPIFGGSQSKCEEKLNSEKKNNNDCKDFDGDAAYECVSCQDDLSCKEFFDHKSSGYKTCQDICDKVCK